MCFIRPVRRVAIRGSCAALHLCPGRCGSLCGATTQEVRTDPNTRVHLESESALPKRSRQPFPHNRLARDRALIRLLGWGCPMTEATAPEVCRSSVDGHLLALFEAAQHWIYEQGLGLVEIESILGQSGKRLKLYRGRLAAEKLPESSGLR